MDTKNQHSMAKRPYESPTVNRVYIDPVIDMLTACFDPDLGQGKTSLSVCGEVAS